MSRLCVHICICMYMYICIGTYSVLFVCLLIHSLIHLFIHEHGDLYVSINLDMNMNTAV